MARASFLVKGTVQGVGYRAATAREARRLGLEGWVKNLADGSVQVVAAGAPAKLQALEEWLHVGPRFARVSSVDPLAPTADDEGVSAGFSVR